MRTEIAELQRQLGVTTVYVTHDQVEAMTMGHRIAVFENGRILQVATPAELYRAPASKAVGTFIGSPKMNILPASIQETGETARIHCLGTTFGVAMRQFASSGLPNTVDLGLRPDDIHWTKDAPSRCAQKLTGTVGSIETTGSETFVFVTVGGIEINSKFPSFAPVRLGDQVDLVFDPSDLHFFDVTSGVNLKAEPERTTVGKEAYQLNQQQYAT
jgi:multiple sugar transport system ATP-binding protein